MNFIEGTQGNDILLETFLNHHIYALDGNDEITVGAGEGFIDGGNGFDYLTFDYSQSAVDISLSLDEYSGEFYATYRDMVGSLGYVSFYDIEHFSVLSGSGSDEIRTMFDDRSNNYVSAGAGDDEIYTGLGNDTIDGGEGIDRLMLDFYYSSNGVSSSIDTLGNGIFQDGTYQITFSNIEVLDIFGSNYDDRLAAMSDSYVNGGNGYDTLVIDYSDRSSKIDVTLYEYGFADETSGELAVNLVDENYKFESVRFDSIERFEFLSGSGDDHLDFAYAENSTDDIIFAGAGDDFIASGMGNDIIDGGEGYDFVLLDFDSSFNGVTSSIDAEGNVIFDNGTEQKVVRNVEALDVFGSYYNDRLTAMGDSYVYGGNGYDTLIFDYSDYNSRIETGIYYDEYGYTYDNSINGVFEVFLVDEGYRFESTNFESIEGFEFFSGSEDDYLDFAHFGSSTNDAVFAGAGNDMIMGGMGSDTIDGGEGYDHLFLDFGMSEAGIYSTQVGSTVFYKDGTNSVAVTDIEMLEVLGTDFDDEFIVTDTAFVYGNGGKDTVKFAGRTFAEAGVIFNRAEDEILTVDGSKLYGVEFVEFDDVLLAANPTVSLINSAIEVVEGEAPWVTVGVELSLPTFQDVVINVFARSDSADLYSDYGQPINQLYIPIGETTASFDFQVYDDSFVEADEQIELEFSIVSGQTFDNSSQSATTTVTIIDDDGVTPSADYPISSWETPVIEYGEVGFVSQNWQTINLNNSFINPVVFVQHFSEDVSDPATVRISNVNSDGFDLRIQEPNYLDGYRTAERVSYFVVEAGTWQLADGTLLQAGMMNSDRTVSREWESINFDERFANNPAVFTQIQTENDADFARIRSSNVNVRGFEFAIEEEEANKYSTHGVETLGWMAIESGSGSWSGNDYQIGVTDNSITHEWQTLGMDSSFATQAPQFLSSLSTYNGGDAAGVTYRPIAIDALEIRIQEDTSNDSETEHIAETVSYMALAGEGTVMGEAVVSDSVEQTFGETGTITFSELSQTVELLNSYDNPVVFLQPASVDGWESATVRMDNVTGNSFDAWIQQPDYLASATPTFAGEIDYFVFEAGVWELADGTRIEVGLNQMQDLVARGNDSNFAAVDFATDFVDTPVVLSQVQTSNDIDFVRTRQRNSDITGFELGLEAEEARTSLTHGMETVGWLAMETGSGQWGDFNYYVDRTNDTVTHKWTSVDFDNLFARSPQIAARIGTYDGPDASGLGYSNLSATGVDFRIEEERSLDSELSHTTEIIDFLAIDGVGSLSAVSLY